MQLEKPTIGKQEPLTSDEIIELVKALIQADKEKETFEPMTQEEELEEFASFMEHHISSYKTKIKSSENIERTVYVSEFLFPTIISQEISKQDLGHYQMVSVRGYKNGLEDKLFITDQFVQTICFHEHAHLVDPSMN